MSDQSAWFWAKRWVGTHSQYYASISPDGVQIVMEKSKICYRLPPCNNYLNGVVKDLEDLSIYPIYVPAVISVIRAKAIREVLWAQFVHLRGREGSFSSVSLAKDFGCAVAWEFTPMSHTLRTGYWMLFKTIQTTLNEIKICCLITI